MRLQLRTKLLVGFIVVALIGSVIGAAGTYGVGTLNSADTRLYQEITLPLENLARVTESFQRIRVDVAFLVDSKTADDVKLNLGKIKNLREIITTNASAYSQTFLDAADQKNFEDFDAANKNYQNYVDEVIALSAANKIAEAKSLLTGPALDAAHQVEAPIDRMLQANVDAAKKTSTDNTALEHLIVTIMLSATGVGLLVSILLAIWIGVFMVSRPLKKLTDTLSSSSTQIASASSELSSSSEEIANGAQEQASSIEETTASMEELASMVKQNTLNAQEASNLSERSSEISEDGYQQMEQMLTSMSEINRSSTEIGNIIRVIDDIAFQTNILALNAAVEAARAGEAGMGFAVVADEVKQLANKSADAAKEISTKIQSSIKTVEQGQKVAGDMAEVFKEMQTMNKKVLEMIREVDSASRQQDTGISEVNKAILQFDQVVQENAQTSEASANAAEELMSQAEALNEVVDALGRLVTGKIAQTAGTEVSTRVLSRR